MAQQFRTEEERGLPLGTRSTQNSEASQTNPERPHCLQFDNIETGQDFARLMSALMSDVVSGRVDAPTANAACNAGSKLLKVVEMQYKYGSRSSEKKSEFRLIG